MFEEVLRLADRPVHTIMTHRRDLVWLDLADSVAELRGKIRDSEHSRFPVKELAGGNSVKDSMEIHNL